MSVERAGQAPWVEVLGVVTRCRFQFARMSTLTFGIQTEEKFRIGFDYYAQGRLYSDEFQSLVAIPQGERIKVSYNPLRPIENSRSSGAAAGLGRSSLVAVGVTGPVMLFLVWLALMRGCR